MRWPVVFRIAWLLYACGKKREDAEPLRREIGGNSERAIVVARDLFRYLNSDLLSSPFTGVSRIYEAWCNSQRCSGERQGLTVWRGHPTPILIENNGQHWL